MEIELTKGFKCLIDDIDAEIALTGNKWIASKCGNHFYAARNHEKKRQYLHRVIAKAKKGEIVDHINGNTLDNRRENLRICTRQQNIWNMRDKPNRFRGVVPHQGKWTARITVNYKNHYIGIFAKPEDAARAYNEAAKKHFGEFARLNNVSD